MLGEKMAYEQRRTLAALCPVAVACRLTRSSSRRGTIHLGSAIALLSVALHLISLISPSGLLAGVEEVDDAIILDNDEDGTSSNGLWFRVSTEDDWGPDLRVTTSTESNATYRFRVDVPSLQVYEVFLWWP